MRAPSPENANGACRGAVAEKQKQVRPHFDNLTYSQVQDLLTEALDCERYLARRQYRLRVFVLNCQAYLDHLDALGDALGERRAS